MKINKWIKNIVYVLLIIVLLCSGMIISASISRYGYSTFDINRTLGCLTYFIFYGGIGVILGLDNFIKELKKEGKWRFDIPKLIIFGLPFIIFSIPHVQFFFVVLLGDFKDFINTGFIHVISSVVLGYTIISSVSKEEVKEESEGIKE